MNIIARRFVRCLRRQGSKIGLTGWHQVGKSIKTKSRTLIAGYEDMGEDKRDRFHLEISALILASYRSLQASGVAEEQIIDLLNRALFDAYRGLLGGLFKIALLVSSDGYRFITRRLETGALVNRYFGDAFSFYSRKGEYKFDFVVNQCLYHDFFQKNGAPELTAVVCFSDYAWMDIVKKEQHKAFVKRPMALGHGNKRCIFHIERYPGQQ